jgi:asparagine synthetase B (glutamine-hydrolysing)
LIGIFGNYRQDAEASASLTTLSTRLDKKYSIEKEEGEGCSLGRVTHATSSFGDNYHDKDCRWRAVVVGEIFNIEEIIDSKLSIKNLAELFVNLLRSNCLHKLKNANGLFCAAIYDSIEHTLFLITDRFASYPIHFWSDGHDVLFSSHIYSLLSDDRVSKKPNKHALAQLFTMQRTVGRFTSVSGIEALPAACIWTFKKGHINESFYWALDWKKPECSEKDAPHILVNALKNAVNRQSSGEKTGLLLSGGLDSRMILSLAPPEKLSCWTTSSFDNNPEMLLAKKTAESFKAIHKTVIVEPSDTLNILDQTVIDSNGLYPASTQFSAFMPKVSSECNSILTGHGLDYTLRGYYLPSRFIKIGGSNTRLPALRKIKSKLSGNEVLQNLRQGPPISTVDRIVRSDFKNEWWNSQAQSLDDVLQPWLNFGDPYNAWDAFILHSLSKHYAFSGMMAVRAETNLRMPAFDWEVFSFYLKMPPIWRCRASVVLNSLRLMSPIAAALPNANTHFRADLGPWLEIAALMGRGMLRRLGIAKRPQTPSPLHSSGSWQNLDGLYRYDPAHKQRFIDIKERLDLLSCGVLRADGIRECIDEHLNGYANHTKLLRQLLTHDSWVRSFGITNDG